MLFINVERAVGLAAGPSMVSLPRFFRVVVVLDVTAFG